jgi:hypothetical protein
MKALLAGVLVVAAAGMMGGCAPQPLTKADVDGRVVCNADYMYAVEQKARREGMQLQWVNCPQAVLRAS